MLVGSCQLHWSTAQRCNPMYIAKSLQAPNARGRTCTTTLLRAHLRPPRYRMYCRVDACMCRVLNNFGELAVRILERHVGLAARLKAVVAAAPTPEIVPPTTLTPKLDVAANSSLELPQWPKPVTPPLAPPAAKTGQPSAAPPSAPPTCSCSNAAGCSSVCAGDAQSTCGSSSTTSVSVMLGAQNVIGVVKQEDVWLAHPPNKSGGCTSFLLHFFP
jgi:hypothetical protein